jgi:hypothetical protein
MSYNWPRSCKHHPESRLIWLGFSVSGWRAQRALVYITDGADGQHRQYGNDEFINAASTCHHDDMS